MAALTIKNIPDDLYRELKRAAEQRHRSINSEVIVCLKEALMPRKTPAQDRLASIRAVRDSLPNSGVSINDIDEAINSGRP